MQKIIGWILVILGGLWLIRSILGVVEIFRLFMLFAEEERAYSFLFSISYLYEAILCLIILFLGVSILKKNNKDVLFALSVLSFLFFLFFTYFGFASLQLAETFTELNIQLPLVTQLWTNFWWLPPIIFLVLFIWLFLKYKRIK